MSDEQTAIEAEEPQRPEWLPDNFKSPEDLASSYKELERKLGELGTKASRVEELEAKAARADEWEQWYERQQQEQRSGDPREKFLEVWEDPDRQPELVLHLAERLAAAEQRLEQVGKKGPDPATTELAAEYAETRMRQTHADWDTYRDQISEVVRENPRILGLTEQSTPAQLAQGLDAVYWMVKGRASATDQGQAASNAAEAARIALEQAQTMTGGSARPATQTPDQEYWDRIAAANSGGYGS